MSRSLVWRLVAVLSLVGLTGLSAACSPATSTSSLATDAKAVPITVVSLTFDDGLASHYTAMSMMRARGQVGTFYIISGLVGSSPYYMPWSQVHAIADAGNEIGGHTVHHTNLTTVDPATARAEACDSRTALLGQGFSPVSAFAYPDAAVNPSVEQIVAQCGYSSGRGVGSLAGPHCPCPYAEALPPADPDNLRTAPGATTKTTPADLEASVTNAETHGGGWVTLVFHGICDDQCTGVNSVSTGTFAEFLDWLGPRAAHGTVVRTVSQAMAGTSPVQIATKHSELPKGTTAQQR